MLRICRLFRVFRFFRELGLLALLIIDSMRSLMWALIMLAIITYIFAVCFTDRISEIVKSDVAVAGTDAANYFGSLSQSLYTLCQAILSGLSWGVLTDSMLRVDLIATLLLFFYLFFTIIAVLNIITGIFVENAVETAKSQQEVMVEKEQALKQKCVEQLTQLFRQVDENASGIISLTELTECTRNPKAMAYLSALGLDEDDADKFLALLDDDGSGDVDLTEFLNGCLRLKGPARSADIVHLIHLCNRIDKRLGLLTCAMDGCVFDDALPVVDERLEEDEDKPHEGAEVPGRSF